MVVNLIKYLFPSVGALLLIGGFYWDKQMIELRNNSQKTTGTVTKLVSKPTDSWSKAPVIEFVSVSGQTYSFRSNVYSRPPAYEIGESVDVLYDSNNLNNSAKVDSFISNKGVSLILFIIGGVLIFIGVTFIYTFHLVKDSPDLPDDQTPPV